MMPSTDREAEYQRRLEAESRKWGSHLQVEASGQWLAWLDHPLIVDNYRRRSMIDGLRWTEWVRHQLGRPARKSLDLGCGAGETSFSIHEAGSSDCLEGFDVSTLRIEQAEEQRLKRSIPGRFAVADVNRVELPAGSYDLIFSNHSFHHFVELEDIMQRVHRALTPDGFFILEEYVGPTQFQWTEEQIALVQTRLSLLPERLRVTIHGTVKSAEGRPTVEAVTAESPFESIRSAEIAPLFQRYFEVVAMKPLGGTIQHLLYNGIMHQFAPDDAEAMRHLEGIVALENELIDAGLLPSDFMLLIGRKRQEPARDTQHSSEACAVPSAVQASANASSLQQSLLGRVFDAYQNMMQISRCIQEAAANKAVSRPRVLELSRYATGLTDYLPEAKVVRHPTHEDDKPILDIPVSLPFPDKSFDACLVTDAYEHIPAEMRPSLLGEMIRVTHGLVLLGCPQHNEIVSRFDQVVFDFIWGKYAERFEPLEQHHEYGLDSLAEIEAQLRSQGASQVISLPNNYVYRWIHMILIYFDLQHRHPHGDLFEAINRIYNQHLSSCDYREPCYRYLMLVPTDPTLDMAALTKRLQGPAETPARVAATEGALIHAFQAVDSRISDRLRHFIQEVATVHAELDRLRLENQQLRTEIQHSQAPHG